MNEIQDAPPATAVARRHWLRWIVGAVVVLLLGLVLLHLFESKKAARGTAPQVVKVAKVARGDMPETLSELGTVTPNATVTVLPQLSGYLTEVGYQEGENVKKGQFLAQIDPRQYEISLQQAQASLLKDQTILSQARSDLARYHELRAQKAIAEQTVADQEFLVTQEEAQVKLDEASVAQFRLDLTYCRITAPVSGRVGLRLIDPGNYVTASSSPGIVVITTMKPTTVQFTVAQNDIGKVIQRVNSGAQLAVTAYTSDNSQEIASGTLYALSNQMATSTGTVTLRAKFANDDEALFPNEFVNIKILVDTLKQAVLVPTPAVLNGAPGDYVYLVNANDTVSAHKVTLGATDGQNTAILSGLSTGDTVVVDGTDRLTDGASISIASPTAHVDAAASAKPTPGSPPYPKARQRPSAGAQGASSSN
ncbi:MAG: efflux RND transporter periplasmic adaptor subunit [Steroidobacteraceae bacterium]